MTEPIDPPDALDMHRALDRLSALAGQLADQDITLIRTGIQHAEDTIRGLMDTCTEQHEELLRADIQHAIRGAAPPPPGPPPPGLAVPEPGTTTRWPWQNPEAA